MSATRKKKYRPRETNPCAHLYAFALAAKLREPEREAILEATRLAFEALRRGEGTVAGWRDLADAFNVAEALIPFGLANDHAETFRGAQLVLRAVAERFAAKRSWTMYAVELEALRVALLVHRVQLENCSAGEFQSAVHRVQRRVSAALRGDGATDAIHLEGVLGAERPSSPPS